jgi:hypothetical protein
MSGKLSIILLNEDPLLDNNREINDDTIAAVRQQIRNTVTFRYKNKKPKKRPTQQLDTANADVLYAVRTEAK